MSWLDRIQNVKLSIVHTVITKKKKDRIEYKPLWINAQRVREFNVAEFNFPGVDGTLVYRSKPKGRRYSVEFIFQGADNLVHAENFENSSKSPIEWEILHPIYGQLFVQPLVLEYDNRAMNVTRITGEVMETIVEKIDKVKVLVDPVDTVGLKTLEVNSTAADVYATTVPVPKSPDVKAMKRSLGDVYNGIVGGIKETTDYEGFFNAFNEASAFVDELLAPPGALADTLQGALNNTIAMMEAPARFADSVQNRVAMLKGAFDRLAASVTGLTLWSVRRLFELHGSVLLSSIAQAAVLPLPTDYRTRREVVAVIDVLGQAYNDFLTKMDELQSEVGGVRGSFVMSVDVFLKVDELVNYTLLNLWDVASNARQERVLILEEDMPVVVLAKRLYGLLPDDSTIDRLIGDNDIVGDELLLLLKGRRIVYYV